MYPGQYTPIVNLKDAAGCTVPNIGTNMINVDAIVQAKFKADRSVVCDSGMVNFKDTSSLGPNTTVTSYTWDFGDGSGPQTGMFPTISHNYTTVGNYTATMSITTLGGCTRNYLR